MIFKKLKKNLAIFFGLGMSAILATSLGLFTTACTTVTSSNNSSVISARENTLFTNETNREGLTTIEYNQEKWIGDNSVSIAILSEPNVEYISSMLNSYLASNESDVNSNDSVKSNSYTLVYSLKNIIKNGSGYSTSNVTAGTGWILDYSIDKSNDKLITYYVATNMHVLNATFTISYQQTFSVNNQNVPYTINATFPISAKTSSNISVYLSQPQYNSTSASNNLKIPLNNTEELNKAWYKTPISISNFNNSLIPLGAYNASGTPSTNTSSYNMQISFYPTGYTSYSRTYYFLSDGSSGTSSIVNGVPLASDFSVLKFTDKTSSFNSLSTIGTYGTVFTKIKEMFKVDTDDTTTAKNSSYIARLNKLITLTSSEDTYDKEIVDDLFMFADYSKDLNSKSVLSTAGFPATSSGSSNYINFNSNTISYSLVTTVPTTSYSARTNIEYNQNGNIYYSSYSWPYNLLMRNVNLLSGSSGSMTVDQDYKILGIYWGTLSSQGFSNGQFTRIVDGVVTRLYTYSDNLCMINIWLKYVALNDKNSKLYQLFTNLKNFNYFS